MSSAEFSSSPSRSPLNFGTPSSQSPRSLGGSSPALERLSKVKESVTNLHGDLRDSIGLRKQSEESKVIELREMAIKSDKNLALEIKRRSEADKVLQELFENSLAELRDSFERKLHERTQFLQSQVDGLQKRCAQLEKELSDEREAKNRAVEETGNLLMREINMLQSALDAEKVSRLEKEAQLVKKEADDTYKLNGLIESERLTRDQTIQTLREEIEKSNRVRDANSDRFQARCVEEIESVKVGLRMETESREASEEEIVRTMKDVIGELREGLHILSK